MLLPLKYPRLLRLLRVHLCNICLPNRILHCMPNCTPNRMLHCMLNRFPSCMLPSSSCSSHRRQNLERKSPNYPHFSITFSIKILPAMHAAYIMESTHLTMLCIVTCEHNIIAAMMINRALFFYSRLITHLFILACNLILLFCSTHRPIHGIPLWEFVLVLRAARQ